MRRTSNWMVKYTPPSPTQTVTPPGAAGVRPRAGEHGRLPFDVVSHGELSTEGARAAPPYILYMSSGVPTP